MKTEEEITIELRDVRDKISKLHDRKRKLEQAIERITGDPLDADASTDVLENRSRIKTSQITKKQIDIAALKEPIEVLQRKSHSLGQELFLFSQDRAIAAWNERMTDIHKAAVEFNVVVRKLAGLRQTILQLNSLGGFDNQYRKGVEPGRIYKSDIDSIHDIPAPISLIVIRQRKQWEDMGI